MCLTHPLSLTNFLTPLLPLEWTHPLTHPHTHLVTHPLTSLPIQAQSFVDSFTGSDLWVECMGSDHCPVWATLDVPTLQLPQAFLAPALSTSHTNAGAEQMLVQHFLLRVLLGLCPYAANAFILC